jgi:hypothetical protein
VIAIAATVSVIAAFTNAARVCGPSTPSTNTQVPAATATAMTAAMPRSPRNTAERGNGQREDRNHDEQDRRHHRDGVDRRVEGPHQVTVRLHEQRIAERDRL